MNARVWTWLSVAFAALIAILVWRIIAEGVFSSEDALDDRAASLEAGALDEWPFDGQGDAETEPDDPTDQDAADEEVPSMGLDGEARLALHHLAITDKKGRHVLRVRRAHTSTKLTPMHEGTVRIPGGHLEGVEITLYRDAEGKISLASALKTAHPSVQRSVGMLPPEKPEGSHWAMEVGPITIKDAILTIGFTAKPVKFRIDHGVVRVKQTHDQAKPRIYFDKIEGAMLEPSPLPKPIRIAFAKGLVRLDGHPMVELAARTCIGQSELRVNAVVPARKKPVELTGDSVGLGGALGRMGLKIAAKKKSDKIHYHQGAVHLEEGPGCGDPPTADVPQEGASNQDADGATEAHDAAKADDAAKKGEAKAGDAAKKGEAKAGDAAKKQPGADAP